MKNLTFSGIDASNEISLMEYGLLVSNEQHEDGSKTHFVVYRQGEDFGTGHISESEINGFILGDGFPCEGEIQCFLEFVGDASKNEWIDRNIPNKLHDLINYFGIENIMGCDYSPISEEQATELYL